MPSFWEMKSFADVSSVLALAITFVNSIMIIRIRKNFLINATLEPLIDRLRQNSLSLNITLALFEPSIDDFNEGHLYKAAILDQHRAVTSEQFRCLAISTIQPSRMTI